MAVLGFIVNILSTPAILVGLLALLGLVLQGKPAEDEAKRKRSIDQIDVTGNAAMARVTLDYPSGTFTDYFVLLKVDGEWKIANKVWTRNPKPATP